MPLIPPTAYNALMGMFRPQAAPAGASAYDQALAQARSNALGQFGMGLVAAAIPQTAAQRVQSLQGALGSLQPSTADIYNQAQARLMFQQAEDSAKASERMRKMSDTILAGLAPPTTATASVVPPMPSRPTPSQQTFAATTPQATIAAPPPPTATPSSGITLTEPEKLRIQNAAALGDEEVIKEYNLILKDREKVKDIEYLEPKNMYIDGEWVYGQAAKTGGKSIKIGKATEPEPSAKQTAKAVEVAQTNYYAPNGQYEKGMAAADSLSAAMEAKKLLDQGIATGPTANMQVAANRILSSIGLVPPDNIASNTEAYRNFITGTAIPMLQQLGGNDSDREFMELKALAGGDVTQLEPTLKKIVDYRIKLSERKYNQARDFGIKQAKLPTDMQLQSLEDAFPDYYGKKTDTGVPNIDFSKLTDDQLIQMLPPEERSMYAPTSPTYQVPTGD